MNDPGATTAPEQIASHSERPWAFGLIIAPVAVLANGVIAGALSLLLRKQGVSPARQGEIISFLTLPQTIYFLWSPITDFWLRRRNWLILGALAAALVIIIAFH